MVGKITQKWGAWLTESRGYALSSVGLLILRVGLGVFMAGLHGWGKLTKVANGEMGFADPLGIGEAPSLVLAMSAEFACSILLVLGLFTRLACVPLIAVFIVHGGDPWSDKELAYLYLAGYLTLLFAGPGKFSVDALIMKR